jgi:hypothetical protein
MTPLDVATNERHDCPVRREQQQQGQLQQSQQRRYLQCNKGCGPEIHFDAITRARAANGFL